MKTLTTLLIFNLVLTACIQGQKCVRTAIENNNNAKAITAQKKEVHAIDYRKMKPLRRSDIKNQGITLRTLDCITK